MSTVGVRLVLTFNFSQKIRACGWTEGYDLGYADIASATAPAAANNIMAFMLDRCYCLGVGPYLIEAVIYAYTQPVNPGDPPARRSSVSILIPTLPPDGSAYNKALSGTQSSIPGTNYWADFGTNVYYIALASAQTSIPVYRRNCWIAGLPDVADETDSPAIVDPSTNIAVAAFLQDLANFNPVGGIQRAGAKNQVSIRSIARTTAVKPCTAWNLGPPLTFTVPGHGYTQGQPVSALGMKVAIGGTAPKGRYLVGPPIDANTIQLQGVSTVSASIHTGTFRAWLVTFNPVSTASPLGFTKRNKGRPRGLSVGRRSTARIKRA